MLERVIDRFSTLVWVLLVAAFADQAWAAPSFVLPLKGSGIVLITEAGGLSSDSSSIDTPCGLSQPYDDPCHHPDTAFYALDFDAAKADVVAAGDGDIVYVSPPGDKYQQVVIKHPDGYYTVYAEYTLKQGLTLGKGNAQAGITILGTLAACRTYPLSG